MARATYQNKNLFGVHDSKGISDSHRFLAFWLRSSEESLPEGNCGNRKSYQLLTIGTTKQEPERANSKWPFETSKPRWHTFFSKVTLPNPPQTGTNQEQGIEDVLCKPPPTQSSRSKAAIAGEPPCSPPFLWVLAIRALVLWPAEPSLQLKSSNYVAAPVGSALTIRTSLVSSHIILISSCTLNTIFFF